MVKLYPWQQALWQQMIHRPQQAHAYLLHGTQGIGKRAFAESLMAYLLCQQPVDGMPCGQCKSCHLLAASTHPDVFVLEPEGEDKPIKVDQVRDLVGFVSQTAQMGGRKVLLIEPAEAMNLNAANALLKSLEEPSGDTVILMISHQLSRLLPTIRSRCMLQAMPLPSHEQTLQWLAEALPDEDEATRALLVALAVDSPLKALRLHELDAIAQRAVAVDGIKKLLKQQVTPSQLAETLNKMPLIWLMDWFLDWSQAILRYQLTQDEAELGLDDMAKVVQYLASKASRSDILQLQDWLLEQRQKVLGKANLNPVLLLEALLIRWFDLLPAR